MNKKEFNNIDNTQDPIYYNLTLNRGFTAQDNTGFNTPARFTETNSRPFLENTGDYYIAIMRTTIPTSNIPRYIFPIQTNLVDNPTTINSDIDLSLNTFTFKYATAQGIYLPFNNISDYQLTADFQSEVINPLPANLLNTFSTPIPPSQNNGVQDVRGFYYYVFYVETLLNTFNDTLKTLYENFRKEIFSQHSVALFDGIYPFFTYDHATQLFSFNAENTYFNQSSYPRVELYIDGITSINTWCPAYFNATKSTPWDQFLLMVNNYGTNTFIQYINGVEMTYIKNTAIQSSLPQFSGFQKIVFEVSGDLSLKYNESDAIPTNFGQSTSTSSQKPEFPMLTDLEVSKDEWAVNSSFIQFQASAMEQVRLISLTNKSFAQNFNLNIYWVDNFGNKKLLEIPSDGNPLTVKLAFFKKKK